MLRHTALTLAAAGRMFLAAAFLFLALAPAHPTILLKLSLEEMIDQAELIFIGTVSSKEYRWPEDKSRVFTFITFETLDILKGSLEAGATTFTLRHAGGELPNGIREEIVGMPSYNPGQRVLLFVKGNLASEAPILGMAQGSFRIAMDPQTGADRIVSDVGRQEVLGFQDSEVSLRPKLPSRPPPEAASPGEEDDPRAKQVRLQMEREEQTRGSMLLAAPSNGPTDLIRELRENIETRRGQGKFQNQRPEPSAEPGAPSTP